MHLPHLPEFTAIMALAVCVRLICHKLRIPQLISLVVTGIVVGPSGLHLAGSREAVNTFAELGVILLLYTIGMEVSLRKLGSMWRVFFLGGVIQVALTVALGALVGLAVGREPGEAIFLGCLLSLSSTAIVLKWLSDHKQMNSPQGRTALNILIFQDMIIVLMILLTPLMAGKGHGEVGEFFFEFIRAMIILVIALFLATRILPILLDYVYQVQSREVFLMAALALCLAVAWLAQSAGLSLSLGAFLAGLMLSDTEFRHQAAGDLIPLQGLFTSFFFISIGMLLDLSFVADHFLLIVIVSLAVVVLKIFVLSLVGILLQRSASVTVSVAMMLAQVGEFSLVLAREGMKWEITTHFLWQLFLAVTLMTMMASPFLLMFAPSVANRVRKWRWTASFFTKQDETWATFPEKSDHVVIAGGGLVGTHVAQACGAHKIDYTMIEINPQVVKELRRLGDPVIFGDALHSGVMHKACLDSARMLVVCMSDVSEATRLIHAVKRRQSNIKIVTRTPYHPHAAALKEVGADQVVVDEMESSLRISELVLQAYEVTDSFVEAFTQQLRKSVSYS